MYKITITAKSTLLFWLLVFSGCKSLQASSDVTGQQEGELSFQGIDRNYIIYTPQLYSATKAAPLIVVLHGGHGDAKKSFKRTGFDSIADKEGFIAIYPEAVGNNWNDGRKVTASEVDDVAYINALIDHISSQRNIDSKRVYVTGLSSGGMMTQRLACESPQRFAAFASVIANIPVSLQAVCKPKQAVALMMINGSADPLMPPAGGEIKKGRWIGAGGTVISTQQTAQFWSDTNQCKGSRSVSKLPDKDPADGTRIEKTEYTGCRQGGEVVLYTVEGGGHTWPGSKSKPFFRISGKTSYDMKASEVIWEFFNQHLSK